MPPQVCLTDSQARKEGLENALAGVLLSRNQHLSPLYLKSLSPKDSRKDLLHKIHPLHFRLHKEHSHAFDINKKQTCP